MTMQKGLVLQYQLHNRVENFADISTRCSGLLQGEDDFRRRSSASSSLSCLAPSSTAAMVSTTGSLVGAGAKFALKKTRASGRNVGKVFNPVVKLVLENQPFLMPEPAEKPSLHMTMSSDMSRSCMLVCLQFHRIFIPA